MRNPGLMNDVPSTASEVGRVVGGRYQLQQVLGQGGMGVVFAALQHPLGRNVVVKLIRPASSSTSPTESAVARFVKEAEMLARFAHPHIVQLYDQGEHDGEVFLVMEHLVGRTLAARIGEGPLPWRFALSRIRQVALALAEAHAHGVVHRDLKPNNVFLVEHRGIPAHVKVLDFGLARLQASSGKSLTESGELLGTPGYVSPEQIEGAPATEKSDLYALGVMLYECLTGANPFVAETPVASLMRHLKFKAPPPSTLVGEIPERVDELLRRLLQKEPALRPKSADEVIAAIDDALATDGVDSGAVDGAVTKRIRSKRAGGAVALRAALSAVVLGFTGLMLATMPSAVTRALTSTDQGRIQAIDPLPPGPVQPPAVVALGRALFIEPRLSKSERVSCATCHSDANGTTPESRTLLGETGKRVKYNTPSTWNAPTLYRQTWTGEVEHLDDVVTRPITNPDMMASSWELIVSRLQSDPAWSKRFKDAGVDVDEAGVKRALVSYMTASVPLDAPFDRFLRGDASAVTGDVRRGADLFSQYGCSSCHQGKAVGGNMQAPFGVMSDPYVDRGLCESGDYCRAGCADGSTCAKPAPVIAADAGAGERRFRVPSLRNVALTGPYFHDGSARTLEEAVDVMARVQLGLTLSPADRASLVAFLQSLTGERGRP